MTFLTAIFALCAAAAWGSGDFTGGIVARRIGTFHTMLIPYVVSFLILVSTAILRGEQFSRPTDLMWGALAGVLVMAGYGFLLHGFASGRMGIVAPVSGVLATAIPVIFAAFTEGLPRGLQLLGFGLALVSIWMLSRPEKFGSRPEGLGMALLAGLGFGGFFTALDQVGESAVFWPLAAGRLTACVLMVAFAVATRRSLIPDVPPLALLLLLGLLDVGGNLFFLLAVQTGRLDVAAVLASLYPAITAIFAWLITREYMAQLQVVGVAVAVLAIILITI
ncbi:MAG TPA: EamA family transporter [Anaerolineales bacterium]|nr:EamA family transporter [Anaerolineales bacterium]